MEVDKLPLLRLILELELRILLLRDGCACALQLRRQLVFELAISGSGMLVRLSGFRRRDGAQPV